MTKHLAFSRTAHRVLLGMAALLSAGTAARADPTILVCHINGNFMLEEEPTTINLNEAQRSVSIRFDANHYTAGGGEEHPSVSIGPLSAEFGSEAITFANPGAAMSGDYVLDRLTGALANTSLNWRWTCQPGKKQF